jgi:hypothetical protein
MAHAAFEGLIPVATYYTADSMLHEDRPKMDALYPKILSMHITRTAAILLCVVTELQAHFRFDDDGARIKERICEMWNALMPVFEVKELYQERYVQIMKDRGIR